MSASHTTGDYQTGGVEVRYDEPEKVHIDELVAKGAWVHLERMDTNEWCLIVETDQEKVCLSLSAGRRTHVEAREMWREIGSGTPPAKAKRAVTTRRSEAQK